MRSSAFTVVFDTSVLALVITDASFSKFLFDRVRAEGGTIALTPQLYAEVVSTLHKPRFRRWLRLTQADIDRFLRDLPPLCLIVRKVPYVHGIVKADPDDDKILAAALASHASYVVTEDRHLLDLKHWRGIAIVTRRQFAGLLDRPKAA